MKNHDRSKRTNCVAAMTAVVEPRRLLAAMSLLGVSLGVSGAAPAVGTAMTDGPAGMTPIPVADNKSIGSGTPQSMGLDVKPGATQGFTYQNQLNLQSNQQKALQSNQQKAFQSNQQKALPAVQSPPKN
jgi:hypothetical protein